MSIRKGLVVLSALLSLPSGAEEPSPGSPTAFSPIRREAAAVSSQSPAMRVVVDPRMGTLRLPSPEESRSLEARRPMAGPSADLPVVTRPDGSRMIRLDDRHFSWATARIDGGAFVSECTRASVGTAPDGPAAAPPPNHAR